MKFSKMNGIGNDYIFIDARFENINNPNELSIKLSDRHFGIGGDGLVLIEKSTKADFKMRMFNSDGSEGNMCGNAIRCIGKYVYDKGLSNKTILDIETKAGIKKLELIVSCNKVDQVKVKMGTPSTKAKDVPINIDTDEAIDYPLEVEGKTFLINAVSMGNPHCVIFASSLNDELLQFGKKICEHHLFPQKTNVEFVRVIDKNNIEILVYERGTGETLACGTGASASFYASYLHNYTDRHVKAKLKGGYLNLELANGEIFMTGKAELNFEGEYF